MTKSIEQRPSTVQMPIDWVCHSFDFVPLKIQILKFGLRVNKYCHEKLLKSFTWREYIFKIPYFMIKYGF